MLNERAHETFIDRMNLAGDLAAHATGFEADVICRQNRITITLEFEGSEESISAAYTVHLERIRRENIAREEFDFCAKAVDAKKPS